MAKRGAKGSEFRHPYLNSDEQHFELRNEDSDSSDLEEEMARDYECFPDSDDDDVRRGNFDRLETTGGVRSVAVSSYSVNNTPDENDFGYLPTLGSLKSNLRLRVQSSKAGSPRTAFSKASTARALEKVKEADKGNLGILLFIGFCFLRTMSYVLTEMLYNRNDTPGEPELKPFQMLFMRSVLAIGIQTIELNRRLKKYTWDDIARD